MASPAVPNPATPSAPSSSRDLGPGSVLAERYRIDELLGKGRASEVYLAEQVLSHRKVAVKVVHADHPHLGELADRFEREAMVAAGIENPNIAGALEAGRFADGSLFFVSEYVPGKSLRAELASGPLSLERSLHIAKQVASALADTHELGIVHHDLKPENLMLLRRGDDPDFVKVLDFGLPHTTSATKPGSKAEFVLGTPGYMPPEQGLGQPADGRADLYSLGVVLFEMVAGVRLFEGSSGALAKQLAGHVPTFAERAPAIQVSPELEKLVNRLLAPGVAERFVSADDVLEAINELSAGARPSAPPPPAPPARLASEKPVARVSPVPPPPVVRTSAPPPMMRRTQSGPPVAADRLPPFEPPPPAKVPHAAAAPVDDSNAPTALVLPKVSALPPLAPLPSVSAATAPPPAKPLKPAATAANASAPSAAGGTRAGATDLLARARNYAQPIATQLKGKRKQVAAGVLAAGLGVSLLAFFAFRAPSHDAPELRLGLNGARSSASSRSEVAAPLELPAGKLSRPPLAAVSGSDEAAIFLALASDYARDHREVEAVALVSRLLARQPELKDDPRVAGVLSKTVRAELASAADESLGLLTSVMGEKGAELVYTLSLETNLRDSLRRRVDAWLASKDFDRVSSSALYSAVKLRSAKTCDQKHTLLSLAADVGGQQTLELLRELDARTICGANDLKNCYPCLASDSKLKDSIQRVEKRLAQGSSALAATR